MKKNLIILASLLMACPAFAGVASVKSAVWEISAQYSKDASSGWLSDNVLKASMAEGKDVAYMSLSGAACAVSGKNIGAKNPSEGSAFVFVWPDVDIPADSSVDFMATMYSTSPKSPKYWIFEYEADGRWCSVGEDLKTAPEDSALKYSLRLFENKDQYASFVQSFPVEKALKGDLRVRLRAVGPYVCAAKTPAEDSFVGIVNQHWRGASLAIYSGIPVKDTRKILEIGNSFTYFYGGNFMLKEIARSQGHQIRMRTFCKGGQYFRQHIKHELAREAIQEGGYEYAVLQDQTTQQTNYFKDTLANANILEETKAIFADIRKYSPAVKIILEAVQSFPQNDCEGFGNFDQFDYYQKHGAELISQKTGCSLSPVRQAFTLARREGIPELYHKDQRHPSRYGIYLKACVNYLVLYGEAFDENVTDCGVKAEIAAKLRRIAERVVLGGDTVSADPKGRPLTVKHGARPHHVQGIVWDEAQRKMYFSFTTSFVSTDAEGNVTGTVEKIHGHLGAMTSDPQSRRVYASLECKSDEIGSNISKKMGLDEYAESSFFVAEINPDAVNALGVDMDDAMTLHKITPAIEDFNNHRYGCSGIDGVAVGRGFGSDNSRYLYVAYGVYSDTTRTDNDYQVILQYRLGDFSKPAAKYFVKTGNTRYGVQNLAIDPYTDMMFMAVYKGEKSMYPNYNLFAVDMKSVPCKGRLDGVQYSKGKELLLPLAVPGWNVRYGATGMYPLGDGLWYISENSKPKLTTAEKTNHCTARLYKWQGADKEKPFKAYKKK